MHTTTITQRQHDPVPRCDGWRVHVLLGVAALAGLAGLAGCESNRQEPNEAGPNHAAAGPRVVENTLASSWQSTGQWVLEEDLRLYGPPGGYFGVIGALATDSRDNIFVLDGMAQQIHVFDSEGAHVRTVGGKGEGPGEFRMATALAIGPGDSLWVTDPMTRRYSVFGPNGGFARVLTRRVNGEADGERCSLTAYGSYLEWATRFPNEEGTGELSDIDLLHFHPVRVSTDGDDQDTLPRLEFTQTMADMPSMGMRRPVWIAPALHRTFDCSGSLWFAHSGEYRLHKRTLDGDTTVITSLTDAEAADVDEADRDEVRRVFGGRPEVLADQLRALPRKKPIIEAMLVDGEGHVFVIPETSRVEPGTAIDVFREDGAFEGRMAVPDTVTLTYDWAAYATPGYLLFSGADDAGTPYVTRLRIRR